MKYEKYSTQNFSSKGIVTIGFYPDMEYVVDILIQDISRRFGLEIITNQNQTLSDSSLNIIEDYSKLSLSSVSKINNGSYNILAFCPMYKSHDGTETFRGGIGLSYSSKSVKIIKEEDGKLILESVKDLGGSIENIDITHLKINEIREKRLSYLLDK